MLYFFSKKRVDAHVSTAADNADVTKLSSAYTARSAADQHATTTATTTCSIATDGSYQLPTAAATRSATANDKQSSTTTTTARVATSATDQSIASCDWSAAVDYRITDATTTTTADARVGATFATTPLYASTTTTDKCCRATTTTATDKSGTDARLVFAELTF